MVINENTVVMIVETNPHRRTSAVWTGAATVAEVISVVQKLTAFSAVQPFEFLRKNNLISFNEFLSSKSPETDDIDYSEWEESLPTSAHFEAAIDCAKDDGHKVDVFLAKESAIEAGAPRYMNEENYLAAVNLIFGE